MNLEIRGAWIVTPTETEILVEKKDIYILEGNIYFSKPFEKADRIIDATNKIVFPGFVNAHHHIYSTLSKGVPCEVPFKDFEGNLKQLWWTLDHSLQKEDMILSTAIAAKDSIKQGVTTIFDHHISGYTENSLTDMSEVFDAYGISGTLAFELSDRNGEEFFQKSLDENVRFAKAQKGKSVQGMIGLHASFTLSDESLQKIANASQDFPVHVHVAEGEIDGIQCLEKYGKGLIERFDSFGLLRDNSLLIHCSNLTEKDIEILKNRNVFIAQALDSNLNNALNVGNISQFISEGIKTTVGTDGMHSSAMKAYKNSLIFTKFLNKTPDIGYPEMQALFLNSFKLKKAFGLPLGVLEDESADLAIFDYEPATPFNTDQFLGHFIFGITESRCQYVIKNDEILLDDYHITKDLYQDLFERSWEISGKMFKRFEENKKLYE
ncbi:MAG: amidohydrolase family protein [Candidatus Cloacimonetes bacterium]|nr:amidohydrolase family protein [Candidatus Cloacimonadota bacterium]MCF7814882.1 amidohydrolase family protein [Candidatus Cloacimonadota bacterium]MCF7868157.1 amidohydrolase family protein [Candidatus Cloacimonadota bacterium]MCF7884569.1 amidohydrolase family protein [Candidatus Cloacimonadota bacterium]